MIFVDELFSLMSGDRRAAFVGKRHDHQWCHMWAGDDIEELHAFAKKLGLKREWFQPHRWKPHYDLTPPKREKALALGAEFYPARDFARGMLLLRFSEQEHLELLKAQRKAQREYIAALLS